MCKKSGNPVSYSAWSSGNSGFLICQIEIIFDLVLIFQRFLEHFVLKQKINLKKLPMYLKYIIARFIKTRKTLEDWQCETVKFAILRFAVVFPYIWKCDNCILYKKYALIRSDFRNFKIILANKIVYLSKSNQAKANFMVMKY